MFHKRKIYLVLDFTKKFNMKLTTLNPDQLAKIKISGCHNSTRKQKKIL